MHGAVLEACNIEHKLLKQVVQIDLVYIIIYAQNSAFALLFLNIDNIRPMVLATICQSLPRRILGQAQGLHTYL